MTSVRAAALACALITLLFVPAQANAAAPATPTVTRVAADSGAASGGEQVTVSGAHFVSVEAVRFGAVDGRSVHVIGTRKLTVIAPAHARGAVHVRVVTAAGTSAKGTADEFTYLPDPVSALAVADTTGTSVLLEWQPAAGTDHIVVRRAGGTVPPTANSGSKVATLPGDATGFRDTGLVLNTKYAYAVFANAGSARSPASTATARTAKADRPAVPTELAVGAQLPPDDSATACSQVSPWTGALGGSDLVLGATISDPDEPGTPIRGEFDLRDVTDPAAPENLVTTADEAGWTPFSTSSPALVTQRFPASTLTDGHRYEVDARTSTGSIQSRRSAVCSFGYDAGAPSQPKIVMKESTVHVGDTVHITVTSTEPQPSVGASSGIDHFGYSTASASSLAGDGGTHVAATGSGRTRTAKFMLTPTAWGTNYLYVHAVDAAGNPSTVETYSFYVAG
jgi:hypothetical protein